MGMILALDFDGVICDSVKEHAVSSWLASMLLTHSEQIEPHQIPDDYYNYFCIERPELEVGYQGVQIALNYQNIDHSGSFSVEQLSDALSQIRDARFEQSPENWCRESPFYPGVAEALRLWIENSNKRVYIVTKKLRRYTQALLLNNKIDFPVEHLHGLEDGPKEDCLRRLQLEYPNESIYFVEDRLATLERIANIPEFRPLHLVFASWGYSSADQRQKAKACSNLLYFDLQHFIEL